MSDTERDIEYLKECALEIISQGETTLYTRGYTHLKNAIKALEKQVPMERLEAFGWKCPNCQQEFVSDRTENYCPKCGQRLKELE